MSALGRCNADELLNDRQRRARTVVGVASLGLAVLAARRPDVLGTLAAAGATLVRRIAPRGRANRIRGLPGTGRDPKRDFATRRACRLRALAGRRPTPGAHDMTNTQILHHQLRDPPADDAQLAEVRQDTARETAENGAIRRGALGRRYLGAHERF